MNYQQIIQVFKSLCESTNSPIKTFIATNNQFVLNDSNIDYPCFVFDLSTLINTTETQEEWTVAFWVLDKPLAGEPDVIEVLTRTESIGKNAIYLIDEAYEDLFLQPLAFSRIPIIEDFADRLCGWRFETTLKNIEPPNVCTTEWGDAAIIPVGGEGMGIDGGGGGLTCDDLGDCAIIQGLQTGVTGAQNTADSAVAAASAAQNTADNAQSEVDALELDVTALQAIVDNDFPKKVRFGLPTIYFDPLMANGANISLSVPTTLLYATPVVWKPGASKQCTAIDFQVNTLGAPCNIRLVTYTLDSNNQLGTLVDDSGAIPIVATGNYSYIPTLPFSMPKNTLFATGVIADGTLTLAAGNTTVRNGSSLFTPTAGTFMTTEQRIQITTTLGTFSAVNSPAGQTNGGMTNQYILWYTIQ